MTLFLDPRSIRGEPIDIFIEKSCTIRYGNSGADASPAHIPHEPIGILAKKGQERQGTATQVLPRRAKLRPVRYARVTRREMAIAVWQYPFLIQPFEGPVSRGEVVTVDPKVGGSIPLTHPKSLFL